MSLSKIEQKYLETPLPVDQSGQVKHCQTYLTCCCDEIDWHKENPNQEDAAIIEVYFKAATCEDGYWHINRDTLEIGNATIIVSLTGQRVSLVETTEQEIEITQKIKSMLRKADHDHIVTTCSNFM
jgi:hypothetical protein